jgi:hypothetical protein
VKTNVFFRSGTIFGEIIGCQTGDWDTVLSDVGRAWDMKLLGADTSLAARGGDADHRMVERCDRSMAEHSTRAGW